MQRIVPPLLALFLAGSAYGQTTGVPQSEDTPPGEGEVNTGQDPTKPLTRLDLRYRYRDNVRDTESHIGTVRADKPFVLDGGWSISTRLDLPFIYSDVPGRDNPNGDFEFGLSDLLVQALLITPPYGKWAFAAGTQIIFPAAGEDQFGAGKYQLAPTVAGVYQLPEIGPGSFAGVLLRQQFSFAGVDDRADVNDLIVQPLLNLTLPQRWFVTIAPEIRFNFEEGGEAFVPFNVTLGRNITRELVASVQLDVPLVNDYEQYDWQVEFRVGFFF